MCFLVLQIKEYDYYGSYDIPTNKNHVYNELLGQEYTFEFPPHHDIVSILIDGAGGSWTKPVTLRDRCACMSSVALDRDIHIHVVQLQGGLLV